MPRADEPRKTVRISNVDYAVLEEAARIRGRQPMSLLRELGMEEARRIVQTEKAPRGRRTPVARQVEAVRSLANAEAALGAIRDGAEIRVETGSTKPKPIEIPKDGPERTAFFLGLTERKR